MPSGAPSTLFNARVDTLPAPPPVKRGDEHCETGIPSTGHKAVWKAFPQIGGALIAIGAGVVIGQEAAIWCICVGLSLTAVQFAKSRRSNPVATTIALTAVCAVIGLAGGLYIAASWLKLPPETPGFFLIRNVVPPELPRIATSVNVVALEKPTPTPLTLFAAY